MNHLSKNLIIAVIKFKAVLLFKLHSFLSPHQLLELELGWVGDFIPPIAQASYLEIILVFLLLSPPTFNMTANVGLCLCPLSFIVYSQHTAQVIFFKCKSFPVISVPNSPLASCYTLRVLMFLRPT